MLAALFFAKMNLFGFQFKRDFEFQSSSVSCKLFTHYFSLLYTGLVRINNSIFAAY